MKWRKPAHKLHRISHTFNVKRLYFTKERFGKSTDKEREKEREQHVRRPLLKRVKQ
jgi:hypothetical protein